MFNSIRILILRGADDVTTTPRTIKIKENITIRIIAVVFVIVSCWKLPRKLFPIWYGNFSPNIKFHIIVEYNLSNWFVARVYISNYSKAIVLTIIFNSKLYFLFKPCSSTFRKILFLVEYLEILCTFIMYVVHYAKQFCNIKSKDIMKL